MGSSIFITINNLGNSVTNFLLKIFISFLCVCVCMYVGISMEVKVAPRPEEGVRSAVQKEAIITAKAFPQPTH